MLAIVTGASKGIGRAIAEKLAKEGMDLAICSRNARELVQAAIELRQLNPAVRIFEMPADLGIKQEAQRFGQAVLNECGIPQLLVNNAGSFVPGDICTEPDGALEDMIASNLYSAYHLSRVIIPAMKTNDPVNGSRGHVINISSIAALQAYPQGGAYSISKYAMEGFSVNLRGELKTNLIKVSTINPGATMSASWSGSGVDADRIMKAEDIAEIVWCMFRLSPQTVVEQVVMRPQLGDL